MRKAWLAVGFVLANVGCSGAPDAETTAAAAGAGVDERVGRAESAIIGGTETTAYPAVVAIGILIPDPQAPSGFKQGLCTGTLVAKDASAPEAPSDRVLTAAHCVDPAVTGSEDAKFVVYANEPNLVDGIADENKYEVERVEWHRGFNAQDLMSGNDIAVLRLARPVANVRALPYNADALPSSFNGSKVTSVGFGLSNGFQQTGAGVKREAEILLSRSNDKLLTIGQFFGGARICQGDSGGPVLATIGGALTVVGVHSFGFIFCIGEGNATNVATYKEFVDREVTLAP
jgi:secreted trypsin-like serine protease